MYKIIKGVQPPSLRKDFPRGDLLNQIENKGLRELVFRMLEKNPKNRLSAE